MGPRPAIVCLTASGAALAAAIAEAVGGEVHGLGDRAPAAAVIFDDARAHIAGLFVAGRPIIGICAAGILIRAVAPFLADKRAEPAVVAVAEPGDQAVVLLGGHHGGNRLARGVAAALKGTAVITTAGDAVLGVALDEPPAGWVLANPGDAKGVTARLLAGAGAQVEGTLPFAGWTPPTRGDDVRLIAGDRPVPGDHRTLVYHPLRYCLGVGAARHCPEDELHALARQAMAEAGIAEPAIAGVFSLDLKMDEPAVAETARRLGVPALFFTAAELEREAARLHNPSKVVYAEVGCHGVAEGAALAAAGPGGELVVDKRKSAMATVAIARAAEPLVDLPGRVRGHLSVVGIGPGEPGTRTPAATRAIHGADELVGYGLYLDLLGPLAAGRPARSYPLGDEEARCRHALERAGEGKRVALVCSGDPGIYAMAALVFELVDRSPAEGGVSAAARRAAIEVVPGVSAMQVAAARLGAPLGHDFCAISLSDLLTPRATILGRVEAAARGDFVIAFYNPVSRTRRDLLGIAREVLLRHRPGTTPVALAFNLGRDGERLGHCTLATLEADDVDMLTTVVVGSSRTRRLDLGGQTRLYTPRGYAGKIAEGVA